MNLSLPCTAESQANGICYGLPVCGYCYDMGLNLHRNTSTPYEKYNLVLIGGILPIIGTFGLIGNLISFFVFSRTEMRSSINTYLTALACSDITIIITAFLLFFLESIRKRSALASRVFAICSPVAFPMGLSAQSMSVFLTVAAAADCYISVTASDWFKNRFCRINTAYCIIAVSLICALAFNCPHWFEIFVLKCYSIPYNEETYDVCPTTLRLNDDYYTLYYAYCYTIVMAVGPLLILIGLNVAIVYKLRANNANGGDSLTLVLVVCLFIACNILPLTVNFLELCLNLVNTYMIDVSNVMVVLNSSCNVIIYYNYCHEFRETLNRERTKFRHVLLKRRRGMKFSHELVALGRNDVGDETPRVNDALLNKVDL